MKKVIFILFLAFGSNIGCTVVDTELFELVLEIKNQNQELLDEVKSLQAKSDSLINELKRSVAKQEELLSKVTELQAELAKILTQIGELTEKLDSQDADLEAIKAELADLQEKYQAILEQLEQLQQLSQILAEIETLKSQLTELDGKYQVILGSLAQNEEQLAALKNQIEALQNQLSENLNKISELTSMLGTQGVDIDSILTQIEELKASCNELKELISSLLSGKSPVPVDGLMGWYPFSGDAKDMSGKGFDGIVIGAELTQDRFDASESAYYFKEGQSISLNGSEQNNFYPLTVSLWYNISSLNPAAAAPLIKKYSPALWNGFLIGNCICNNISNDNAVENNGNSVFPYYIKTINDRIIGYYGEPPFLQEKISLNVWYHYVFIADENGGKIFVNGELIQEDNWTGISGSMNNNLPWVFGGLYDGWYNGKLDDIAIWNRALNQEEISKIYKGEGF